MGTARCCCVVSWSVCELLASFCSVSVLVVPSFRRQRTFLSSTRTDSSLLVGESQRASGFGALPFADVDLVSVVDADVARMASSCSSKFALMSSRNCHI